MIEPGIPSASRDPMIEIEEALRLVLSRSRARPTVSLPNQLAVGRVLAEDIRSDVDSPPHDKSLVDGFAVRLEDARAGEPLRILELVVAGQQPTQPLSERTATQIMTGAPVPVGTQAVVMVEQTEAIDETTVRIVNADPKPGQGIMPRATSFSRNEIVLKRGHVIRPLEVGLLCEVGVDQVRCFARPRVAVLPTGDELVACSQVPGPGQIRNSNGPMLEACVADLGCETVSLGVGRDDESLLRGQIAQGLDADVLVLSGGVSAGVRDLVPAALKSLGVVEVFHKVRLKPGKPLWFGCRESDGNRSLVFGLPGNPVSSFVCFLLFVRPAIQQLSGHSYVSDLLPARLTRAFRTRGNRPTYYPGDWCLSEGQTVVAPLNWRGSSDIRSLTAANCLIAFPSDERELPAGEMVDIFPLT